jgi:hypothetical protein
MDGEHVFFLDQGGPDRRSPLINPRRYHPRQTAKNLLEVIDQLSRDVV